MVKTDHVLFVAAGAFHVSKPSDLIPELQGRFPIRVELKPLTEGDFVRIMTEPENALTRQYAALVEADGAKLTFTEDGIAEIARIAAHVNDRMENIGARRLHTVMTTLLEEVLYELPDSAKGDIVVDRALVTMTEANRSRRSICWWVAPGFAPECDRPPGGGAVIFCSGPALLDPFCAEQPQS